MLMRMSRTNRSRGAWIWVAVAAITFASLARAQSGIESARAYAAPVIKFLAGTSLTETGVPKPAHRSASSAQGNGFSDALNLLPVFFVGVVAPLSQQCARSVFNPGRVIAAPGLPLLFQRPPPPLA
jgi:hypothetical protein